MFSSLLRKKCTSCPLQYLMMKTPSCSLWSHQHFDPLNKPSWTWTHLSSSCDAQKLNFRSSSRLKPCEHFSPSASSGESADAWTIRRCRWCNKLQGDRGGCRRANVGGESRWLNLEAANKRNDPEQRKWPQVFFFSSRRCEYEDESALLRWTKRKQNHHLSVCLLFNFNLLSWFLCICDVVVFPKIRLLGTQKSNLSALSQITC